MLGCVCLLWQVVLCVFFCALSLFVGFAFCVGGDEMFLTFILLVGCTPNAIWLTPPLLISFFLPFGANDYFVSIN